MAFTEYKKKAKKDDRFTNEPPMTETEANEVKCYVAQIEKKLDEIRGQERWARMRLQAMREKIGDDTAVSFKEIDTRFMQDIDECLRIIESVAF